MVDIYNTSTGSWSTATLSQPTENLEAAAAGNDIVFAGGDNGSVVNNVVDMYNTSTNTWSTARCRSPVTLSRAAAGSASFRRRLERH